MYMISCCKYPDSSLAGQLPSPSAISLSDTEVPYSEQREYIKDMRSSRVRLVMHLYG